MSRFWASVIVAALIGAAPAPADTVCRPNVLGTVSCPIARPMPRPPFRHPVGALDRVRAEPEVKDPGPVFIPARRTNILGTTLIDEGVDANLCRPDVLGNLHCR
jgi:hypothetical protein